MRKEVQLVVAARLIKNGEKEVGIEMINEIVNDVDRGLLMVILEDIGLELSELRCQKCGDTLIEVTEEKEDIEVTSCDTCLSILLEEVR